jgi:glycerophosphoryl diester phosphodiesterase
VSDVADIFPNRNRSDGYHYVIDFDLVELQNLTIHERIVPFTNTQVYPSRFPWLSRIPFHLSTLNQTLELLLGLHHSTNRIYELLIEIKNPEYHSQLNRSISAILLSTLNAYNLTEYDDPIVIQTFHIEELIYIRKNLKSQLRLIALLTWNWLNESSSDYDFYRSEQGLQNLSTIVKAIAPNMELLVNFAADGSIINVTNLTLLAHKYNLSVYPWTFRRDTFKGNFEQLIEFFYQRVGVDGFITSQPDVVIELLERKPSNANGLSYQSMTLSCFVVVILVFMQIAMHV